MLVNKRIRVSSHPAEVVSATSKPDNMLVVNRVVVSTVVSVAKKERETWTKMRKISARDVPEVRIAEARIAS